ncbi:isochorismatase family protein [Amphibiibacter pelophylacis]|uniref:Isochorismatase family protein n=1 Tax=Amphibiibacter pelophylacis TaxID=1799477 RepID=A0ACC6P5D1_9BURK
MLIDAATSQFVLIDYQTRLMPVMDGGAAALDSALRLARAARLLQVPVLGTEQNPARLGPNDPALAALCDVMLSKMAFSAAAELRPELQRQPQRRHIVLAGCETHVCLLQTVLSLREDPGLTLWVVQDACGSRRSEDRSAALQRLREAGVHLVTREMVIFEWLRDCQHPQFRTLLAEIR